MHAQQDDKIAAFPGAYRGRDRRPVLIALCGSRELKAVPETLIEFVKNLPEGSKILLRRGMKTVPGLFERTMAALCNANGISYEWCLPDPEGGREATYVRDVTMTRRADLVLCFFADERMEGGTEHVVDKALDVQTPVYSWGFNGKHFVRIGEHDPDNIWGEVVPWV